MTDAPERIWVGNWLSDVGEIQSWDIGEWRNEPWPTVPVVEYVSRAFHDKVITEMEKQISELSDMVHKRGDG